VLDRFGCYGCEIPLSVPTRSGFCTSKISLQCSHAPRDADVAHGSDWISICSVTFCGDESGLNDLNLSVISSLPAGHYWNPSDGTTVTYQRQLSTDFYFSDAPEPGDDSIDIDILLSILNSCCNDPVLTHLNFLLFTMLDLMTRHSTTRMSCRSS
jgi:hypothetical protein